jgi:D-cysteine desulfhydrase family pyridoxal phosphate-dependent enzyme
MIPRVRIANLPTPIETLPNLSAYLGGPKLLVKRDDLTGVAMGGNKTRKLEYVIAEAQANGAKTLITVGAAQSNHCRQTAALAARFGFECILVLNGDSQQKPSGNLLLDKMFGVEIVWCEREAREETLKKTFEKAWEAGRRPFLVPLGASTPTGSLGYMTAVEEFMAQSVQADYMVVASSSAGTQAGLVLGKELFNYTGQVLGISIDETEEDLCNHVAELANGAAERLGKKINLTSKQVLVNAEYNSAGYGILGEQEIEAIQLFSKLEGLLLDPVYTGRAAAGMIDLIRRGYFKREQTILFWHTGGTPALFADVYANDIVK